MQIEGFSSAAQAKTWIRHSINVSLKLLSYMNHTILPYNTDMAVTALGNANPRTGKRTLLFLDPNIHTLHPEWQQEEMQSRQSGQMLAADLRWRWHFHQASKPGWLFLAFDSIRTWRNEANLTINHAWGICSKCTDLLLCVCVSVCGYIFWPPSIVLQVAEGAVHQAGGELPAGDEEGVNCHQLAPEVGRGGLSDVHGHRHAGDACGERKTRGEEAISRRFRMREEVDFQYESCLYRHRNMVIITQQLIKSSPETFFSDAADLTTCFQFVSRFIQFQFLTQKLQWFIYLFFSPRNSRWRI